jgi:hypothetical protein
LNILNILNYENKLEKYYKIDISKSQLQHVNQSGFNYEVGYILTYSSSLALVERVTCGDMTHNFLFY